MAYHCYTVQTIPCPNCEQCSEHGDKTPRINVGKRYWRVEDDGTRVELTAEQYADRMKGLHP